MPKRFKSEYYAERDKAYYAKLHELQKQLPTYMKPYLSHIELSKRVRTAIAYTRDLITFMKYIQEVNPLYENTDIRDIPYECIESLTYDDINYFLQYLKQNNGTNVHYNAENALNRMMCTLRGYFGFEVAREHLVKNPMLGAAKPMPPKEKPIERLRADQVNQLLQGIEASESGSERSRAFTVRTQLRDTAIATLLLNTGIRVSECVGLDLKDINFEEMSVCVVRKGGRIEYVYMNEETAQAIRDYIEIERPNFITSPNEPALFLSNRRQRMAVRSIQAMLEKYGRSVLKQENLHPHTLRKTYGTMLYEATSDIGLVSETLGHKSVDTTRKHYADISDKHKRIAGTLHVYRDPDNVSDSDGDGKQ
ncbi:MAG: tyrosine-type recombinase/integrase [Lachnospiraceae bacterium]|nr:tyrosine-type recombinase/integrase [Lachnospiraceae bacterium]